MTKFSELSFETFKELVAYLAEREEDYEDQNAKIFAIGRSFNRFIPNITAEVSVVLNNVIEDVIKENQGSEDSFNKLKELFPDLEFDPSGKSNTKVNYSDLPMKSLTMVYDAAYATLVKNDWKDTSKHKMNLQIWNAYTLKCLRNIDPAASYNAVKTLYFKLNSTPTIDRVSLEEVEQKCEWLLGKNNNVANKLLVYIKMKKAENCVTFLKHFLQRLDLAYSDVDKIYPETNTFIENLKKLG